MLKLIEIVNDMSSIRLDLEHFVQFKKPLKSMTCAEFENLKKSYQVANMEDKASPPAIFPIDLSKWNIGKYKLECN